MKTTVIGSYPAFPSPKRLMGFYHGDKEDPYLDTIKEAVEGQVKAGIDIVSDGQTRDSMVDAFVKKLGGTRLHGKAKVIGEIEHTTPITLDDLRFAKSLLPPGTGLKGIITGPYTLAMSCEDQYYGNTEEMAFAFARALRKEAEAIQEVVDVVQVDEPFFTGEYPSYGKELIELILNGLEVETALHVCGDVRSFFSELIEYKADVLEHEFASHPELLDTVKEHDFPQVLGYGAVRSDNTEVETVDKIVKHVSKALAVFPPEKLILSPDCGLRHSPPEVAYGKLQNLVHARDMVMKEQEGSA